MRSCTGWRLLAFAVVLVFCTGVQQPPPREYQIKAVFLFNFTQFVEWPAEAFKAADAPLIIGVLGTDPFGSYLDETVRNEKLHSHPLIVRRYTSLNEINGCHILFISMDDRQEMKQVLDSLKSRPILTVSDADGFARMGGMIRFINEGGRIKFRINTGPVDEARLIISSKLLRLADIVPSKSN